MTQRIYLDNAATSFPKPECVYDAVDRYNRESGCAVGRGTSQESTRLQQTVLRCRQLASELVGAESPERIIFTSNGTDSLNLAIHGLLWPGDHVVTSRLEHNSVIRPLRELERRWGIGLSFVETDETGLVDPDDFRKAMRPNTRLVALVHASNVTGTIQPVQEIAQQACDAGAFVLIDAAQSAGHLPIDLHTLPADLLACPGHKGLLGPLGTGLLYVRPGIEEHLRSIRQGGTGSDSESEFQPTTLPEKYESGNHNTPGLVGLEAALEWLHERTVESIREHEQALTRRLLAGLSEIKNVRSHGTPDASGRVGVASVTVEDAEPQVVATILEEHFRIQTRAGLHCAPGVHRALGTFSEGGTIRFSVGPMTTTDEIDAALEALGGIAESL